MDIMQLEGKRVKICPRSIKAMDESGKTVGIVTGVTIYSKAAPRIQFDFHKAIKSSGIWGSKIDGIMGRVYIDGGKLYYLHDLSVAEFYRKNDFLLEYGHNREHLERLDEIAKQAAQYMTVINVYFK